MAGRPIRMSTSPAICVCTRSPFSRPGRASSVSFAFRVCTLRCLAWAARRTQDEREADERNRVRRGQELPIHLGPSALFWDHGSAGSLVHLPPTFGRLKFDLRSRRLCSGMAEARRSGSPSLSTSSTPLLQRFCLSYQSHLDAADSRRVPREAASTSPFGCP